MGTVRYCILEEPAQRSIAGESVTQALVREVREETGLACEVRGLLAVESGFMMRASVVLVRVCDGEPNPVTLETLGAPESADWSKRREAAETLPHCRLVTLDGSRHEILHESDTVRSQYWSEVDQFLAERLGSLSPTQRRPARMR